MTVLMGAGLRFGQRVVMMPRFEPVSFLETIQKHRCSVAPLVPPIIAFLAKHPLVAKYDVSSMRAIMSGAAPLDAETQGGAAQRQTLTLLQGTKPRKDAQLMPGGEAPLLPATEAAGRDNSGHDEERGMGMARFNSYVHSLHSKETK